MQEGAELTKGVSVFHGRSDAQVKWKGKGFVLGQTWEQMISLPV